MVYIKIILCVFTELLVKAFNTSESEIKFPVFIKYPRISGFLSCCLLPQASEPVKYVLARVFASIDKILRSSTKLYIMISITN